MKWNGIECNNLNTVTYNEFQMIDKMQIIIRCNMNKQVKV